MNGHTPGPWAIDGDTRPAEICTIHGIPKSESNENGFTYIRGAIGYWDASEAENMANANLIAAAPELLAALNGLVGIIESAGLLNLINGVQLGQTSWYCKADDRMNQSKAAIAKATGTA